MIDRGQVAMLLLAGGVCLLASSGCARLLTSDNPTYNTVQTDSGGNEALARKHYKFARRLMEKCDRGHRCEYNKIETRLQQALVADVRYGPAHHGLGLVYFWQKKLYLAAWEFQYAAKLMPDKFQPLNNLGLIYESVGKHDQALVFYTLARDRAPTNQEVIANLARASFRSGDSVAEMRPLLEDVLAVDQRPEWVCWAENMTGTHPVNPAEWPPEGPAMLPEPISTPKEFEEDFNEHSEGEIEGPELPLIQFAPKNHA